MKKILYIIALCGLSACRPTATPTDMELHEGWTVYSSADPSTRYKATVPSTAMGALMNAGALPSDLLDGTNYRDFDKSIFDTTWCWTTEFKMPSLGGDKHVFLELDGLSYRADVMLNGEKVASADTICGPFRRHSIDITPYIKKNNELSLIVSKARGGEPNIGFVDWNPRPADESMGIFRPVRVRVTGDVGLSRPAVKSEVNTETLNEAWLTVEATLTNYSDKAVNGKLSGSFENGSFSKELTLEPRSETTVVINSDECETLHVENPRLWWCNGMGEPEMYAMHLEFTPDGKTSASDATDVDFGIRTIEDYFTDEGHRGFRLNGKPVLIRSAGWTDDIFLRNDSVRNEIEANYVRDMGLNSIRFENIWGTSGHIYDMCDRLGLLALVGWSCQWEWEHYLGSPIDRFGGIIKEQDMNLIARSLGDQVAWLRNHPSIIAWFVGSDRLPRPELEQKYLKVLEQLDDRPYIGAASGKTSEVTGPTGMKMAGPYEYVAPAYWYSPEAPGRAIGFNTETGIGAQIPQKESIQRMLGDEAWPLGEAWDYHCTTAGEGMNSLAVLKDVIAKRYGEPTDVDDFIRKAEWVNYDGTRTMFEAFRARVPEATGIVQWMLNSAWPATYWQLYDHYLVPTSAYYSLKRSNAPLQLIYDYGKGEVVAVNESGKAAKVNAKMEIFGLNDSEARTETANIDIEPYEPVKVFALPAVDNMEFIFLTLSDEAGNTVAENFYLLTPDKDVSDWKNGNWFVTPVSKHADFTALNALPRAEVGTSLSRYGNTLTVELHNKSGNVAFFNRLAATDENGKLLTPAYWSDNYFSLRPGEKKTVSCRFSSDAEAAKAKVYLEGWNTAAGLIED